MVVMEDVTEEERSAELYVSVHSDKISKVIFDVAKCFWFVCFGV